jgi:hypothetical protein
MQIYQLIFEIEQCNLLRFDLPRSCLYNSVFRLDAIQIKKISFSLLARYRPFS